MPSSFNERLKQLRINKGQSQEEVARVLNIPDSTYRRYETDDGLPKRERLELLANHFEVTVDYLIGRVDDPTYNQPDPTEVPDLADYLTKFAQTFQGKKLSDTDKAQILRVVEAMYFSDIANKKEQPKH